MVEISRKVCNKPFLIDIPFVPIFFRFVFRTFIHLPPVRSTPPCIVVIRHAFTAVTHIMKGMYVFVEDPLSIGIDIFANLMAKKAPPHICVISHLDQPYYISGIDSFWISIRKDCSVPKCYLLINVWTATSPWSSQLFTLLHWRFVFLEVFPLWLLCITPIRSELF